MNFARTQRWLAMAALRLAALAAAYLVLANGLLASGLIEHFANARPDLARLSWQHAYTVWPARVEVSGFQLGVEDPRLQFDLSVNHATVDIVLVDLLSRTFHASRVRAEGVSYRFVLKPSRAEPLARLAAFPPINGAAPHFLDDALPPYPTGAALDAIWSVQLEDVDASVAELWFLEYRYLGQGRAGGAFALSPLRHLEVGPAWLHLDGGALTVGTRQVSAHVEAALEVTIAPVDRPHTLGPALLSALSATLHLETTLDDLSVGELYAPGVQLTGAGRVRADVQVVRGLVERSSVVEAWLPNASLTRQGLAFSGLAYARASIDDAGRPSVGATASGRLQVPLSTTASVDALLTGGHAKLVLTGANLAEAIAVKQLHASIDEARVTDARSITRLVSTVVPVVAGLVLGDGPLVASAKYSFAPPLLTVTRARLGGADLTGAARMGDKGWSGAASGAFGAIHLGLTVHDNAVVAVPLAPTSFLSTELGKAGIPSLD